MDKEQGKDMAKPSGKAGFGNDKRGIKAKVYNKGLEMGC